MTSEPKPTLWVFAGPNGAGKTTLFDDMLRGQIPFVNADEIGQRLPTDDGATSDLQAGRIAIQQRERLLSERESFCTETTLTGQSILSFMRRAKEDDYTVRLAFIGVRSPILSRTRVAGRVAGGGHDIPKDAILRRHPASLANLGPAMAIADQALIFDNSGMERQLLLVMEGGRAQYLKRERPEWFDKAVPKALRMFGRSASGVKPDDIAKLIS